MHSAAVQAILEAASKTKLAAEMLINETEQRKQAKLTDLLLFYKTATDAHKTLDDYRKHLNKTLQHLSYSAIPDRLESEDIKTITVEDEARGVSYRFTRSQRVSCSMPDKEAGYDWLRANGHGDIITETVNAGTLSAFAKSYVADTGCDLPDDIFRMSDTFYTSVTKA